LSAIRILPLPLLVSALCCFAQGEQDEAAAAVVVASKEYFVPQTAEEAVVIRVGAYEAEFVSRLATEEGEVLAESGIPDARMLPLFQYVQESDSPRQIDIEVLATQATNRTDFELELTKLNVRDERTADIATAYRLLSVGLEVLPDDYAQAWPVKIQTLMQAGRGFDDLGMREMRLWCSVYAGHLILHKMRDYQTAIDWARELLALPRIERFETIQFAATKIRSSAMLAAGQGASGDDPVNSPLQKALAETAALAHSLDYRFEEALALEAAGVDLKQRGAYAPALQKLEEALAIADAIAAADLATAIREHVVEVHEVMGDNEASGGVLQDIESHLVETGEQEELALNLLRQGQLFLDGYRYDSAIQVLSRAIELEQSSLTRVEAELALGTALNQAGRIDEALLRLYRAARNPESGDFRQPATVLDLATALDQIAGIHRQQGDFEQMDAIRSAQRAYLKSDAERAQWAYQAAIDRAERSGPRADVTAESFAAAYRQAKASGQDVWAALALLQLCAILQTAGRSDLRCSAGATRDAFNLAISRGSPRQVAEGSRLFPRLLELNGEQGKAFQVADDQVESLLESGPASLGAWYWQWREPLFDQYLRLAIAREGGGAPDASGSLLALARARAVERGAGAAKPAPDEASLRAFLANLPPDAAVLSYYLGRDSAYAWVAGDSSVQRFGIARPGRIRARCAELRAVIQSSSWAEFDALAADLGEALLGPVADALPGSVYLVIQGGLLGIPIDGLRLDDEPLAAGRQVINLDFFPGEPGFERQLQTAAPARVFLAGDPGDWSGEYVSRLETSGEMIAVTERFVGPGLNAVQGVALLLDEFTEGPYGLADLIHLSIPGIVDLSAAHASSLYLSEAVRGQGRQKLDASSLGQIPIRANLVFFSHSEFTGTGTGVDSDLGFISSALGAGADAVIASLWPVEAETRERFVAGFYDRLLNDSNAARALALTKSDTLRAVGGHDWASFQLFLN